MVKLDHIFYFFKKLNLKVEKVFYNNLYEERKVTMKKFQQLCPELHDTLFSQSKKTRFWVVTIVKQLIGLLVVLFLAVVTMTSNYIIQFTKPSDQALIKLTTWISLGMTIITYIYFLSYMFKLNNNISFRQNVYKNITQEEWVNKKKLKLKDILVETDEKNIGYYFNQVELIWILTYFITYLFWIFWAATFISKSASTLNFDQNLINILNFLVNSVGLGVISSGFNKIHREYTRDKRYYAQWLKESKVAYDNLFADLVIVNETQLSNQKMSLKFSNDFMEFYGDQKAFKEWNEILLQKYQSLWREYWNFINSNDGQLFIAKRSNVRLTRIANSFFANFLGM